MIKYLLHQIYSTQEIEEQNQKSNLIIIRMTCLSSMNRLKEQ